LVHPVWARGAGGRVARLPAFLAFNRVCPERLLLILDAEQVMEQTGTADFDELIVGKAHQSSDRSDKQPSPG
jgi:hypothetical protein